MSALDIVHPDDLDCAAIALAECYVENDSRGEGMYRLRLANAEYEPFGL